MIAWWLSSGVSSALIALSDVSGPASLPFDWNCCSIETCNCYTASRFCINGPSALASYLPVYPLQQQKMISDLTLDWICDADICNLCRCDCDRSDSVTVTATLCHAVMD